MSEEDLGQDALDALIDQDWLEWVALSYAESGLGVTGFALFILFAGAVGLFNWTESFRVPAVWLALMAPIVALSLPVAVRWRLAGIVSVGVAMLFVALWMFWQRS